MTEVSGPFSPQEAKKIPTEQADKPAGHIKGGIERVATLPFPGIDNAYICLSGRERKTDLKHGARCYPKGQEHDEKVWSFSSEFQTSAVISFLYDAGNCCAEWDGECGPIQLWWNAPVGWRPEDENYSSANAHWFYPAAFGAGHWSQCAVTDENLPHRFNKGDFEGIFRVLKSWATARNDDYSIFSESPAAETSTLGTEQAERREVSSEPTS